MQLIEHSDSPRYIRQLLTNRMMLGVYLGQ